MKKHLSLIVLLGAVAAVVYSLLPARNPGKFDVNGFGHLPVLVNGRLKPFDTVARTALMPIQNRQTVYTPDGRTLQPIEWLLDVFFTPELADSYQVFLIDDPDLLALLNLRRSDGRGNRRFALSQFDKSLGELSKQANAADSVDSAVRTRLQRATVQLRDNVVLYRRLQHSLVPPDLKDYLASLLNFQAIRTAGAQAELARRAGQPSDAAAIEKITTIGNAFKEMEDWANLSAVPPPGGASDPNAWRPVGAQLMDAVSGQPVGVTAMAFAGLAQTWRNNQPEQFNELVVRIRGPLEARYADAFQRGEVETRFNSAQPFYVGMVFFVLAMFLGIASWIGWTDQLRKSAFSLTAIAWVLTTAGIATRMWLEGRPPVTNLYSSALFVGWGAVALCLVLEYFYRNSVGNVAAGTIGFGTLLIAHHLSLSGDTLEMMRAVLDSNFWLATHVVVVTAGYSATFLAGFLALIYILRGFFTKSLDKATADSLTRMVYAIVCFATLFSLVGTVLGGIWADQSWGRFWGWDPKENGALIIVLWNAIILHARWGGMVKARGLMNLAVFGNIVTAWSWFGVNMLGVGLHSYGFTDSAFFWLSMFALSQLAVIGIASAPLAKWRSFRSAA
jgi:ABC-type transport system involved in cytochrome c biogenesis permease subunit